MQANIDSSFHGATFIQLWRVPSQEEQQQWFATMHEHIHLLQKQPGFRSMTLHPSLDGRNVVVYAQWDSEADLTAGANDPDVRAARVQLDRHGEPDGTLCKVNSVYSAPGSGALSIPLNVEPQILIFVNVWVTQCRERQQSLFAAMEAEAAHIVAKPGSHGMAFHTSLNGERLIVYAQWENLKAFDAAISNDADALKNRRKLAQYGEPTANIYRVDSTFFPLSAQDAN